MTASSTTALMWFRRDLRTHDNAALAAALRFADKVYCVFIFDRAILDPLLPQYATNGGYDVNGYETETADQQSIQRFPNAADRRVEFIHHSLVELDQALRKSGGGLIVRHADASDEIPRLADALQVDAVFANHDFEPFAIARDQRVGQALAKQGRDLKTFQDHVIFERDQILTGAGTFFTVFTPYKRAWLKQLTAEHLAPHDSAAQIKCVASPPSREVPGSDDRRRLDAAMPTLADMGFAPTNLLAIGIPPGMSGGEKLFDEFCERMQAYADRRDFPGVKGPSYLSVHLRFGTVSIRGLAREAHRRMLASDAGAETWLSELIWRDFYFQILYHRPDVVGGAFKADYNRIAWRTGKQADADFAAWCEGRTGYPLIDAAMAQINQSGYMHNRLRMVTASFLIKDLGIDWRRGEAYFAAQLNDYDLSANNGGWQWAASSGCDAQPYFRIFNPITQSEKFDPQGKFIRKYLPQLSELPNKVIHLPGAHPDACAAVGVVLGRDYPLPIVQHDEARKDTLGRYQVVKAGVKEEA